ncbi:hypothetical protein BY458DRAFT_22653 [Sporodiniella umbellata]|nr:hypothetical protein BY458DRAFT_22653 [Sporodiniella umbellata]
MILYEKEEESWYLVATLDFTFGLVPHNYLKSIPCPAVALYPFQPTAPEETQLVPDQSVLVLDYEDPDWWKIESMSTVRCQGLVPSQYLRLVPPHAGKPLPGRRAEQAKRQAEATEKRKEERRKEREAEERRKEREAEERRKEREAEEKRKEREAEEREAEEREAEEREAEEREARKREAEREELENRRAAQQRAEEEKKSRQQRESKERQRRPMHDSYRTSLFVFFSGFLRNFYYYYYY